MSTIRNWKLFRSERIRRFIVPHSYLDSRVIEINSIEELRKLYGWREDPVLLRQDIHDVRYIEDLNQRRLRDVECLATIMRNVKPEAALEIGTAEGAMTLLMSENSPSSTIYTLNIPPEDLAMNEGGINTTVALSRDEIGREYKSRNISNIVQIYENSMNWKADIPKVKVAFIDGCHDWDFVMNDTIKALRRLEPGGFIVWHDFNPALRNKFSWINEVCVGIEELFKERHLRGRVFHLRDSWMGIYQVPDQVNSVG